MRDEEEINPVVELAKNYTQDLQILREIDIYTINDDEINKLTIIFSKYGLNEKIREENFISMLGKISFIINKKLEQYIRIDILERAKEKSPETKPSKPPPSESEEPTAWKE